MKHIAVFCGSSNGTSDAYRLGAVEIGRELVKRDITLIYGGSCVGIMGAVADSVLHEGGSVIGIIPQFLKDREIYHKNLTELIVVDSMHERKANMAQLADGFIALPGGPGTLEEYFEIFTWAQLGLHHKPCGLLNINHYYDPLISLFDHMVKEQFMQEKYRPMAILDTDPSRLLDQLASYIPPTPKTYSRQN